MPNIDLSILNQRQTPAFYADVFANRPAAGFVGRIFVSTDTYAFYRDNGTSWDLIGGPGTGTITGSGSSGSLALWNGTNTITYDVAITWNGTDNSISADKFIVNSGTSSQFLKANGSLDSNTYNTGSGAANQVAFFSGTNSISGENNLWWDSTNNHLGINTNTPGTAADIHHNQSTILQLNQTTATNDTRIAFQNSGTSLWRIGNFYNGGANDLGIFDVVGNIQPVTVKKNTGQVLIGTSTVGSGKLVVASASGDNGIQIVGASAPSLRIDSAESGPTKRAGLGISTATNNFIQGSADRDFCIFNGSTAAASPILFGIYDAGAVNVQEAARISPARNFIIGSVVDAGYKLDVNGAGRFTGVIYADNSIRVGNGIIGTNSNNLYLSSNTAGGEISFWANQLNTRLMTLTGAGNLGIGTSAPTRKLEIQNGYLRLFDTSALSGAGYALEWSSNNGGTNAPYANIDASTTSSGNQIGDLIFRTANGSSPTEKLRLHSSGFITFKGGAATLNYGAIFENTDTNLNIFGTEGAGTTKDIKIQSGGSASAPRVWLKAGGNFLIGTDTDNGIKLQVAGRASISDGLDCNNSFYFRKLTYSTIASGASETQNILFASANARKSLQIVVTAVSVSDAAIIQLKFDIIARWSGGSSLINSGIGNIDTYFSRGIGDFTATSILTPSIGTSGNNLTLILTNSAVGNITNIVVNITENYS